MGGLRKSWGCCKSNGKDGAKTLFFFIFFLLFVETKTRVSIATITMATEQFDADSNVTLINSFSVLVNSLNNHANDLRDVSQLKSSPDGVNQEELVALEQRIRLMEHTFKAVRRHLDDEADAIAGVKNLQNVVHEHTEQIQKICSHLPSHLPQQVFGAHNSVPQNTSKPKQQRNPKPVEKSKENDATYTEVESTNETEAHRSAAQPKTGRKKARKSVTKCTDRIPRLRYLTVDEFSAVPSYIRGRLSLTKVRYFCVVSGNNFVNAALRAENKLVHFSLWHLTLFGASVGYRLIPL